MTSTFTIDSVIEKISNISGKKFTITDDARMEPYCRGWRFGAGKAIAVVKPGTLVEIWKILEVCVKSDVIVIMQAANTGLTGGSSPNGNDYDRPIVIISTLRIDQIHVINEGKQIVGLAGSTLFGLDEVLLPYGREPHSVIGSSCIGASIVGGICNNSGGALVKRGPAYTELSIYAQVNEFGQLVLVNDLGIDLGKTPEEILENLQNKNFTKEQIQNPNKLASDNEYHKRVREVDEPTPARFNADSRRLYGASGSAGRVAVFAVRVDTYPKPKDVQVFYVGTNDPDVIWKIRRDILSSFKTLPTSGEYVHRVCYDYAKKYGKDNHVVIDKIGPSFIPKLFNLKRKVDFLAGKFWFLPDKMSDRIMQFLIWFWPNHLPKRMEDFRDKYEHHWVIEMADEGIPEAQKYFSEFFKDHEGGYFECNEKEAKKAILHRFVAASAIGRYHALHKKRLGDMMTMDIAFPRNEKQWFEKLPPEVDEKFDLKLYYGHLFCHVLHQNYVCKKGVDAKSLKQELLKSFDARGAEYPAEHNVGHEYYAKEPLRDHYKKLDPTNSFNPGIGWTSKKKNWQ